MKNYFIWVYIYITYELGEGVEFSLSTRGGSIFFHQTKFFQPPTASIKWSLLSRVALNIHTRLLSV